MALRTTQLQPLGQDAHDVLRLLFGECAQERLAEYGQAQTTVALQAKAS